MTQAMLPLIRPARGRVVFLSSIGGRMALPFGAPYHASKYGIEAVVDCLRQELRPVEDRRRRDRAGLDRHADLGAGGGDRRRSLASARPTRQERALRREDRALRRRAVRRTAERGIPPEKVAGAIEHALTARRPRTRYLVGADARGQALAAPPPPRPRLRRRSAARAPLRDWADLSADGPIFPGIAIDIGPSPRGRSAGCGQRLARPFDLLRRLIMRAGLSGDLGRPRRAPPRRPRRRPLRGPGASACRASGSDQSMPRSRAISAAHSRRLQPSSARPTPASALARGSAAPGLHLAAADLAAR